MASLQSGERWFLLLLAAAIFAVYAPALPGVFVYDDYPLMLQNPLVTDSFPLSALVTQESARPLTLLSFFVNYRIAGPAPGSFRAVNLGLHVLASVLLFLLVRDLAQSRLAAGVTAAIFALHPLQSQPVNYIWSRSMLLMAVFALAALLLRRRPAAALILAQLAIWSRAEAVVLLVPLLAANRRLLKPVVVLAAANAATLGLMVWRLEPAQIAWRGYDALAYWLQAPLVVGRYITLLLWPRGLALDHSLSAADQPAALLAFLALAAALGWALWRRHPAALGLGWALLWLTPGLAVPNADPINESRFYLALAGPAFAAAMVLQPLARRRQAVTGAALVLLVGALAATTTGRSRLWTDEIALWEETVQRYPNNSHAHYNLGVALTGPDRLAEAERAFARALELSPGDDRAAAALGYCRGRAADWEGARWYYEEALRLNAGNSYARESLAELPGG